MKFFTTDRGIAREGADGRLELLDLAAADLGQQLRVDAMLARARQAGARERVAPADLRLLAPIPRPSKVIGIGINYRSHVEETRATLKQIGVKPPAHPVFFVVPGSAVIGPEAPIVLPKVAPTMVDYEVEFAAVIGRGGFGIKEKDAAAHVLGYTLANDVSARDIQRQAMSTPAFELTHAKGMDGFKPMGPSLVTADEFGDPPDVRIEGPGQWGNPPGCANDRTAALAAALHRGNHEVHDPCRRRRDSDRVARRRGRLPRAVSEARRLGGNVGRPHRNATQSGCRRQLTGLGPVQTA